MEKLSIAYGDVGLRGGGGNPPHPKEVISEIETFHSSGKAGEKSVNFKMRK